MKRLLRLIPLIIFSGGAATADPLLTELPTWEDEDTAYRDPSRALTVDARFFEHIEGGNYSQSQLERFVEGCCFTNTAMHESTEGDDLWTAYHMWKRLEGIQPNAFWRDRMVTYKDFYINEYRTVLADSGRETASGYDHVYGWGLCEWYMTEGSKEADGGAAALETINGLIADLSAWNTTEPGDAVLNSGSGGRRWARLLRLAVAAAEASPTPQNVSWRDLVIDIVLQTPDFNEEYGMYFNGSRIADNNGHDGAAGDRVTKAFHMGILADAMWHSWRVLSGEADARAEIMAERLVSMAAYWRDYGPDENGFVPLITGLNLETGERLGTKESPNPAYTFAPINSLVFGYKLSGDQSYLEAAWALWMRWQRASSEIQGWGDLSNTIVHYADSQLSSADGFKLLRHNKGELQYTYALFENGGEPAVVGNRPRAPSDLVIVGTP